MKISSISNLKKLSKNIKKKVLPGDFILLYGEMGSGKTTFARFFINNYEKDNKIKKSEVLSPTFNISFEYSIKDFIIKHYDLYRLKKEAEIGHIGLFEDTEKSITLVEWPELIKKKPKNRIDIFFKYTEDLNKRLINIKCLGRLKKYVFLL